MYLTTSSLNSFSTAPLISIFKPAHRFNTFLTSQLLSHSQCTTQLGHKNRNSKKKNLKHFGPNFIAHPVGGLCELLRIVGGVRAHCSLAVGISATKEVI